jgi:hypothetical protein
MVIGYMVNWLLTGPHGLKTVPYGAICVYLLAPKGQANWREF